MLLCCSIKGKSRDWPALWCHTFINRFHGSQQSLFMWKLKWTYSTLMEVQWLTQYSIYTTYALRPPLKSDSGEEKCMLKQGIHGEFELFCNQCHYFIKKTEICHFIPNWKMIATGLIVFMDSWNKLDFFEVQCLTVIPTIPLLNKSSVFSALHSFPEGAVSSSAIIDGSSTVTQVSHLSVTSPQYEA